jgi:hypothetical protein
MWLCCVRPGFRLHPRSVLQAYLGHSKLSVLGELVQRALGMHACRFWLLVSAAASGLVQVQMSMRGGVGWELRRCGLCGSRIIEGSELCKT